MSSTDRRRESNPCSDQESARELIFRLLSLRIGDEISHEEFRSRFEQLFNLELEKDEVSSAEHDALAELFDCVVWYSPFVEERQSIPNYVGEDQVDAAVTRARAKLSIARDR